ncbi:MULTISPECIES: DUF2267 domain-containing protein [Streptomyces]|uniref:DUF2267 domain-containing protein n=1 Tax=Streptomyces mirabilis TaxID=68239 RepID=A0ABU3UH77_9ACTN|nr:MULTISPECIES: DUF2267 domain-containing protein [Streptomyces]MCX4613061.1 DUF2267 domain-containing protein [Streptomyces mirabilis]MCX5353192.1 DUF2267 domain-containing protein [Streptomyces mirabilis]MDU8993233.1 DUF2267 domain-containing protein [Streptomyces mirabilis]
MLRALGHQLTGDERVDLAARLPTEAALAFTSQIPDPQPLTGFVKDLATCTGTTPAVARWDTGAVLAVICHLVGTALLDRILNQLCSAAPNSSRPPDSFGQDRASRARSSP